LGDTLKAKIILNSRDVELVDLHMFAFRIWWYFEKYPNETSFTLNNILPEGLIPSSIKRKKFNKPSMYHGILDQKITDKLFDKCRKDGYTFILGNGNDEFVDSWIYLTDTENQEWVIFISSKQRKYEENDTHKFTDRDFTQQINYISRLNVTNWILVIRNDSEISVSYDNLSKFKHKLMLVDPVNSKDFYGPVVHFIRRVSNSYLIGQTLNYADLT